MPTRKSTRTNGTWFGTLVSWNESVVLVGLVQPFASVSKQRMAAEAYWLVTVMSFGSAGGLLTVGTAPIASAAFRPKSNTRKSELTVGNAAPPATRMLWKYCTFAVAVPV